MLVVITCFSCFNPLVASEAFFRKFITQAEKSVVAIEKTALVGPLWNFPDTCCGTGTLVDKERGLVLTNSHVVAAPSFSRYRVTFDNGKEIDATLFYYDPWVDFAFLKIDPSEIPNSVESVDLAQEDPKRGDSLLLIGNEEGIGIVHREANVASLYDVGGLIPFQQIRLPGPIQGGMSGSPALDQQGKIRGLLFAGTEGSTFMIPVSYIAEALQYLQKDVLPPRKDPGLMFSYETLSRAVFFYDFPENLALEYEDQFPEAQQKILTVNMIYKNFPAMGLFEPGDILYAVNGRRIGPALSQLRRLFNEAKAEIFLTVYRHGERLEIPVWLEDLQNRKINQMITFGGATFFSPDDLFSVDYDLAQDAVVMRTGGDETVFARALAMSDEILSVVKLGPYRIQSFADLELAITELQANPHFNIQVGLIRHSYGCDNRRIYTRSPMSFVVEQEEILENTPKRFSFNESLGRWDVVSLKSDFCLDDKLLELD